MSENSIYLDIAERTGGDIYIGVVGPVRTGKSTFIKRFMESLVLPNIEDGYERDRARDEMPQSAAGKTVMTTEPKFIPDEGVNIKLSDNAASLRVKMIDCVGYIVPEALGTVENGEPRMVRTPWRDEPMPFVEAAEIGTQKVINDHSTIGMLITTDGSIGEISRAAYVEAEERVVNELKAIGKPFSIILNSKNPAADSAISLAYELEAKYEVPVALVSCLDLDAEDIRHILELVLNEFPVSEISVECPEWMRALDRRHPVSVSVFEDVKSCASEVSKMGNIREAFAPLADNEFIKFSNIDSIDLGSGRATVSVVPADGLYYKVISELTGFDIPGERELIELLKSLSDQKSKFEKVAEALDTVQEKGYGIIMPDISALKLEEPDIIKQAGGYGVRLRAAAESIHLIRANIETEINPIVGTEQQSEELVKYLLHEFEEDPQRIWESNLFGKSLYELTNEGLHAKLENMPDEVRSKIASTLERIVNEGSSGLICILL